MKKKHLDKIGSMCYIYLLCVSLSVTIILKQHNQLWIEEISPVFRGSKGMIMFVYVHQRPIFCHEINKFEEWFVFSQNLKVYMFLLCDLYNFFLHLQLQKLEFEEFLELLGMSVQMSLDSIDAKLIPFLNMNFLWYSGLFKKLQAKYPDTHRCFTSSDGLVQYIVSWCYQLRYSVNRCFQIQIMIKLDISFSFFVSCATILLIFRNFYYFGHLTIDLYFWNYQCFKKASGKISFFSPQNWNYSKYRTVKV